MYPLYFAKKKIKLIIQDIKAGEANKQKMLDRGFIIGEEISIQREEGENLIIEIKNSYFILGKEFAFAIFVKEKEIN